LSLSADEDEEEEELWEDLDFSGLVTGATTGSGCLSSDVDEELEDF